MHVLTHKDAARQILLGAVPKKEIGGLSSFTGCHKNISMLASNAGWEKKIGLKIGEDIAIQLPIW